MKKCFRPLILFLCIITAVPFFAVSSSAASGNLIDSNLTNWRIDNQTDGTVDVKVIDGIYRVRLLDSPNVTLAALSDNSSAIIAGHSYTLKYSLPTATEINDAFGTNYNATAVKAYYEFFEIQTFIGGRVASDEFTVVEASRTYLRKDTINSYYGKTVTTSFVASTFRGTPCLCFLFINSYNSNNGWFYFSNVSLVDNDDNSAELSGIKGFLHSIRWDLVGGVCDDDKCPHSIPTNPHLSLAQRITGAFSGFTDTVKNSMSDVSTKLTNVKTWLSGGFKTVTDGLSSGISSIGTFFTDIGNDISTLFTTLGSNISAWFDRFKPRVYIDLNWERGFLNRNSGVIVDGVTFNDKWYYTSNMFFVGSEKYVIENNLPSDIGTIFSGLVYYYDENGNYLKRSVSLPSANISTFVFEPGYNYRICFRDDGVVTNKKYFDDYVRIYCDEGWLSSVLHSIRNTFQGFFNLVLYFDSSGNYTNPFEGPDSLIARVSTFLDNLISYLSTSAESVENTIDSATGTIYIFKMFTERYAWLLGLCVFTMVVIVWCKIIGL